MREIDSSLVQARKYLVETFLVDGNNLNRPQKTRLKLEFALENIKPVVRHSPRMTALYKKMKQLREGSEYSKRESAYSVFSVSEYNIFPL